MNEAKQSATVLLIVGFIFWFCWKQINLTGEVSFFMIYLYGLCCLLMLVAKELSSYLYKIKKMFLSFFIGASGGIGVGVIFNFALQVAPIAR